MSTDARDAADTEISVAAVRLLADRYGSSFRAAMRPYAEKRRATIEQGYRGKINILVAKLVANGGVRGRSLRIPYVRSGA